MTIETDAVDTAGSGAPDVSTNGAGPSIEDTLNSAYDAAMARGEATEQGVQETATGDETESQGRLRGPDGKFLPKKANGTTPPIETATGEEAATVESPVTANTNPDNLQRRDGKGPVDITQAPTGWRGDAKTPFEGLPETVRREIHKREDDFHRGVTQYKEAAGFGQQMAQELIPYQQTMLQHGKHPREVVKEATAVWNTLVNGNPQEKVNLWLQIAKDYAIDIQSLGDPSQQSAAEPTQVDPAVNALRQELNQIKGQLTSQERQRAEAEFSAQVESVNAFGSDPKHKHFAAVREDMAALIESGRAKDLQDAYDKAIWINPEVRKLLLAEQDKERADKVAAEAANARKAAGANVTRRGTPPAPAKTGKIEDTLTRRYDQLMGA